MKIKNPIVLIASAISTTPGILGAHAFLQHGKILEALVLAHRPGLLAPTWFYDATNAFISIGFAVAGPCVAAAARDKNNVGPLLAIAFIFFVGYDTYSSAYAYAWSRDAEWQKQVEERSAERLIEQANIADAVRDEQAAFDWRQALPMELSLRKRTKLADQAQTQINDAKDRETAARERLAKLPALPADRPFDESALWHAIFNLALLIACNCATFGYRSGKPKAEPVPAAEPPDKAASISPRPRWNIILFAAVFAAFDRLFGRTIAPDAVGAEQIDTGISVAPPAQPTASSRDATVDRSDDGVAPADRRDATRQPKLKQRAVAERARHLSAKSEPRATTPRARRDGATTRATFPRPRDKAGSPRPQGRGVGAGASLSKEQFDRIVLLYERMSSRAAEQQEGVDHSIIARIWAEAHSIRPDR